MAKFKFYPEITEIDMRDVAWDNLKISGFPLVRTSGNLCTQKSD